MKEPVVYGASRASIPARSIMWRELRTAGANIISSWIDESGEGETGSFVELWARIESEIRKCDRLVLYVENGDMPLKGALVEVGIAIGLGKPIFVVNKNIILNERDFRPLGSWLKHPLVSFCSDIRDAVGLKK
jgi:nucleoside 2-deoxyribosyltransferase